MKYLDERIIATYENTPSGLATGMKQYRVYRIEPNNTWTTIFVGNMYYQGGNLSVDITDIVRNDMWVPTYSDIYESSVATSISNRLVNPYKVRFFGTTNYTTDDIQVAKVYRYPHDVGVVNSQVFFDYIQQRGGVSVPLLGRYIVSGTGYYKLTPKYPFIFTQNYRLPIVTETSANGISSISVNGYGGMSGKFNYTPLKPTSCITYDLNTLLNNVRYCAYKSTYSNATSAYGDYDFSIGGSSVITRGQVQDCCIRIGVVGSSNRITNWVTDWITYNDVTEVDITLNYLTLVGNIYGLLYIVFSDGAKSSTTLSDYDYISVKFNSITLQDDFLMDKPATISFTFRQTNQDEWTLSQLTLTADTYDSTKNIELYAGGDNIAEISSCPSRFYLQWQDRMGAFQSQPFNEHYTYSENFERETITDYKGVKKVSEVNVTPKFKINTDWIKEDLYLYYESIFTSPLVFLYDTKEDKLYSVLVTDSEYTEKTYDNQKKLFNLSLNLELNQQQNIIY